MYGTSRKMGSTHLRSLPPSFCQPHLCTSGACSPGCNRATLILGSRSITTSFIPSSNSTVGSISRPILSRNCQPKVVGWSGICARDALYLDGSPHLTLHCECTSGLLSCAWAIRRMLPMSSNGNASRSMCPPPLDTTRHYLEFERFVRTGCRLSIWLRSLMMEGFLFPLCHRPLLVSDRLLPGSKIKETTTPHVSDYITSQ